MKKLGGFISLSGILALLLVATAACTQLGFDSSSKLIGKWEMIAGEEKGKVVKLNPPYQVIEFFSDKTLDFHGMSFTWTVLEDGRIKLTMSFMGAGAVTYALLQGGILRIPDPHFGNAFRHYRKKGDLQVFGSSQEKDQSENNGFESKEFSNRPSPQDLRRQVEKISEKIRAAHLKKDINKWFSCYTSSYPNLSNLKNRTLELWKNYDIKEVNYRISNVQRVSDNEASADIVWNIQLYDHRTHDYTLVRQRYTTFLEKGQGGWKIRDSKEY